MIGYVIQRVFQSMIVLWLAAPVAFAMFRFVGDPIDNVPGQERTDADIARLRTQLGLDQPFPVQYLKFLHGAVQGDFGISYRQGRPVAAIIAECAPATPELAAVSAMFAIVLGVTPGLLAGYAGGWTETIIMRIADVQLTFPAILVAMLIFGIAKGITPPDMRDEMAIWVLILAIGLSDWVRFARVVRGATLVERSKDCFAAAQLIGRSPGAIMLRHILPNVPSPALVIATICLALAIIAEATLSFLGVGAPPIQPSLGTPIRIGQGFLFSGERWILFFPALTLLVLALSVNLLGDWRRDALNPRL